MTAALLALLLASCDPSAETPLAGLREVVDAAAVRPVHDPALDVRIAGERELLYAGGAEAKLDRPAFVRAGSGLAIADGTLFIAQDDANFIGALDLATGVVSAIALPAGEGGVRLFEDGRGNKKAKMDLEALARLPDGRILAIGSGSSKRRFSAVIFDAAGRVRVIDATAFYRSLEANPAFAGPELNLEGVIAFERDGETWLRLFQRGNGSRENGEPVDATGEVPLADLLAGRATTVRDVRAYDLGDANGIRTTFSDAAISPGGANAFLASAEDSSDTVTDGTLHGVVIGSIDPATGAARYGRVFEADGTPSARKLEGLAWDASRGRWLAVEDKDDAAVPSRLLELVPASGSGWW